MHGADASHASIMWPGQEYFGLHSEVSVRRSTCSACFLHYETFIITKWPGGVALPSSVQIDQTGRCNFSTRTISSPLRPWQQPRPGRFISMLAGKLPRVRYSIITMRQGTVFHKCTTHFLNCLLYCPEWLIISLLKTFLIIPVDTYPPHSSLFFYLISVEPIAE